MIQIILSFQTHVAWILQRGRGRQRHIAHFTQNSCATADYCHAVSYQLVSRLTSREACCFAKKMWYTRSVRCLVEASCTASSPRSPRRNAEVRYERRIRISRKLELARTPLISASHVHSPDDERDATRQNEMHVHAARHALIDRDGRRSGNADVRLPMIEWLCECAVTNHAAALAPDFRSTLAHARLAAPDSRLVGRYRSAIFGKIRASVP